MCFELSLTRQENEVDDGFEVGNNPIAVTWGVFPAAEVAQPTVVDPESFRVWKDEAFGTFLHHWAPIYPEGSDSRKVRLGRCDGSQTEKKGSFLKVLREIHDNYCLVTLVDNDFVAPVILWDVLDQMLAA